MPDITYENRKIDYTLHKKNDVHYIKIYLDDLNGVQVTASEEKERKRIEAFIQKKASWIKEKWEETHEDLYAVDRLTIQSGQKISYLGRSYRLFLEQNKEIDAASFSFQKGKFYFSYPDSLTEQKAVEQLQDKAKTWLKQKAVEKMPVMTKQTVAIEDDVTRLGKKSAQTLSINWRIIQQTKDKAKQTIEDLWEEKTC